MVNHQRFGNEFSSLTTKREGGQLSIINHPAPAFLLCCKSIRFNKPLEYSIKSITQDFTCLPASFHCAGKSCACLRSALNLLPESVNISIMVMT